MPAARLLAVVLVSMGMWACRGDSTPPQDVPPVQSTVADDLKRPMDKARAVEDTTLEHKQELDRALDDAENAH